ncbi:MAG TPA: hypothetical protein VK524_23045 [Polyangiaceae bacterium]|nr:hypothetical protein [Polyangiaceae bacterium]
MSLNSIGLWKLARSSAERLERTARTAALCSITLLAAPAANECQSPSDPPPTEASASTIGPYTYQTYTSGFRDSLAFGAATIYYPTNAPTPFAGVAVSPGFLETQANTLNWGKFLASHGFVVLTFETNSTLDQPPTRSTALLSAIDTLKSENTRAGSPLNGKMSADRYAIMGHSMGGGGTLIAARTTRSDIRAAIPYAPWSSGTNYSDVRKPTLVIAAGNDTIAPANQHAFPIYQSINANTAGSKAYIEFTSGDHGVANDPLWDAANQKIVARYGLSWLKLYVLDDTRYQQFIQPNGAFNGSRYQYVP